MSSDFISPVGAKVNRPTPQINAAPPTSKVTEAAKPDTGNEVAKAGPSEGFSPSSEFGTTALEEQAGASKASELVGAMMGNSAPSADASAGELKVDGAQNTAVNQVHGVDKGAYQTSNGPQPGFSGGTVYSTKPPGS